MNKKILVLGFASLMFSASVISAETGESLLPKENDWEIQLKFGGWSHHEYHSKIKYDFNQSHNGIGVSFYKDFSEGSAFNKYFDAYSYDVFTMTDSFNMRQYQASTTLYNRFSFDAPLMKRIELGLMLGVMSRSDGYINTYTGKAYEGNRATFPFVLPGITWYLGKSLHFDVVYIPKITDFNEFPTTFVRAGYSM